MDQPRSPREVFLALVNGVAEGRFDELPGLYAEQTDVVHPFDPLRTPAAQFTLTIIRDVTGNRPQGPADPARPAAGGEQARDLELAASGTARLSRAELGLRAALEWSRDAARPRIIEALRHLTDGIRILRRLPIAAVGPPAASPGLRPAPGTLARWDQDEIP